MLTPYQVGALYNPRRTSYPETGQFNFRSGQHELVLFYRSPTAKEVAEVRSAPFSIGLFVDLPSIVLLYRLGKSPWSDAPYSWHLVPEAERTLPAVADSAETRALLLVFLVDASTGILRAMRQVTMSPAFTHALHDAIHHQASLPWSSGEYDRHLQGLYRRFPSSADMVPKALVTEVTGAI